MSWEEAHPGARASRPHKSWYSLTHLLDPNRTATAPWLCFGRAQAVPAGSVAGCRIAGKLSGNPRDSMRARRPRSRGVLSRWCAGGCLAGDFSESRRAPFAKLPFVREPCPRRAVRIKRECNNQKSTIPSRPWHPVAANLNPLVALRGPSCPFVDNSFSFVFFLLFQTSVVGEGAVRSGIKLELFGTSGERWGTAAGAAVQRPVGKTPVSGDQRNQHPAAFIRMD